MGQTSKEKTRFQLQLMSALKNGCGTITQPDNDEVIFDSAIHQMILVAGSGSSQNMQEAKPTRLISQLSDSDKSALPKLMHFIFCVQTDEEVQKIEAKAPVMYTTNSGTNVSFNYIPG